MPYNSEKHDMILFIFLRIFVLRKFNLIQLYIDFLIFSKICFSSIWHLKFDSWEKRTYIKALFILEINSKGEFPLWSSISYSIVKTFWFESGITIEQFPVFVLWIMTLPMSLFSTAQFFSQKLDVEIKYRSSFFIFCPLRVS